MPGRSLRSSSHTLLAAVARSVCVSLPHHTQPNRDCRCGQLNTIQGFLGRCPERWVRDAVELMVRLLPCLCPGNAFSDFAAAESVGPLRVSHGCTEYPLRTTCSRVFLGGRRCFRDMSWACLGTRICTTPSILCRNLRTTCLLDAAKRQRWSVWAAIASDVLSGDR